MRYEGYDGTRVNDGWQRDGGWVPGGRLCTQCRCVRRGTPRKSRGWLRASSIRQEHCGRLSGGNLASKRKRNWDTQGIAIMETLKCTGLAGIGVFSCFILL